MLLIKIYLLHEMLHEFVKYSSHSMYMKPKAIQLKHVYDHVQSTYKFIKLYFLTINMYHH